MSVEVCIFHSEKPFRLCSSTVPSPEADAELWRVVGLRCMGRVGKTTMLMLVILLLLLLETKCSPVVHTGAVLETSFSDGACTGTCKNY